MLNNEDRPPDLGTCCSCGHDNGSVRTIVMLEKRAPISGHGWGCVVCGLASDGASYVVCDSCFKNDAPVRFACRGYPKTDGRIPIEELIEHFDHDLTKHPECDG